MDVVISGGHKHPFNHAVSPPHIEMHYIVFKNVFQYDSPAPPSAA